MKERLTLSVVINTKNSEVFLEKALKSVAFADEVVVVDMHSTDATKKIAKKYTNFIYDFDDVGYVEPARNFAISKATKDWILILDADEEVTQGLRKKMTQILTNPNFDAYYIPRSNEIFGKEIRKTGWWPDYQLRLFKKGVVTWTDEIHSVPRVTGTTEYFSIEEGTSDEALLHHNYQSISQFIERMNRYTSVETTSNKSDKEVVTTDVIEAFREEFLGRMFYHKGIEEGMHGVALAYLQSLYQTLVVLKKWEKQGFTQTTATQKETLAALKHFQHELMYWTYAYEIEHGTPIQKITAKIKRKMGLY